MKAPRTQHHDPIFAPLNEPQREAVCALQGPLLILAGAGSGKTRALTHRIAYLMEKGVQPWQILAVTFTNKAADEMKTRIKNLLHITSGKDLEARSSKLEASRLPVMGTFHSICARILRRDYELLGRNRSFVIYDQNDQERLMKKVLKELHVDETELRPNAALASIGRFKAEALSPHEAREQATTPRMQRVIQAFETYNRTLREANALDFDDLILEVVRLFHEVPEVLDRYQETWLFLNVDEYQDTNHAQYLFVSLLAQKYRNLCVIGDPDQSIYAFRGADIRNILEFEQEYSDALRIKLEQNYRSTQPILTAANAVIAANPNRPQKEMWTERREGPQIVLQEVRDATKEAEETVHTAEQLRLGGVPFNEQVILYRTNAQSRLFEEACLKRGIPYRVVGGLKFYARREVKDVLAYLYVLLNSGDTLSLLRILNVPSRKIGDTTIGYLQAYAQDRKLTLWETLQEVEHIEELQKPTRERLQRFVELIERFRIRAQELGVCALTEELLTRIEMEKWLRDGTDDGESRWENVQELLSVMHKYDALEPWASLTSFLEEVALVSEVDALTEVRDDALTLMTVHLCKGLEFESVTIAGCEEGIFPHASSLFDQAQLEEERRLMYVGMTRAKTYLRLMCARSRMLWGEVQSNASSRFLDDLPDEVIERRSDDLLSAFAWAYESGKRLAMSGETASSGQAAPQVEFNQDLSFSEESQQAFAKGARIEHPAFGKGTIVAHRGDIVEIEFDSGSRKRFAISIAPLRVL